MMRLTSALLCAYGLGLSAAQSDPLEGYAFLYFTGSTSAGENIYLAASTGNNALNWTELNGGQPILPWHERLARSLCHPLSRG
jgi:hypothetical protein